MSNEHDLRHHLRYRTLAAFHLTAEVRSATRAAELLGITQPAVSQLLAGLERAVGFPLFARGVGRAFAPVGRDDTQLGRVISADCHRHVQR